MNKNKICIVGAGLAGGVIASALIAKGYDVTLIEQGKKPHPYDYKDEEWHPNMPRASFTRGVGLGGTSNYWHGGLTLLDQSDIDGWSDEFQNKKLPIDYSEMRHYYSQALKLINEYSGTRLDLEKMESLPEERSNQFELNTQYFRYKGLVYPKKVFCTLMSIHHAQESSGFKVLTDFVVRQIKFSVDNRVESVEGIWNGKNTAIKADLIVLCAGGMGSPKILQNSLVNSIALQKLPIGKYLTDHPSGFVFKARLRKRLNLKSLFGQEGNGYRKQYGIALNTDNINLANGRNHIIYLRPAITMKDPLIYDFLKRKLVGYKGKHLSLLDIAYLFKHIDLLFEAINFKFGLFNSTRYVSGLTFMEQSPMDGFYMTPSQKNGYSIHWNVSDNDRMSIAKFIEKFFDEHKHIFEDYVIYPDHNNRLETAGHHSGGCRASDSPSTGVVDGNLKVFGVDNLFVADGSVIGYTGHANTGLTILALALKCVDSIENSLNE